MSLQKCSECGSWHRGDEAIRPRLHAGGPKTMVNSRIFAEYFTRSQHAKTHTLTVVRIDSNEGLPCGDEKDLVGRNTKIANRPSLLITPPGTAPLDARQGVR